MIRPWAAVVRLTACLGCVAGFSTLGVAAADADVFAAVQVHPPGARTDFDIEVVDAATGAQVTLPPGVNTTADELHPSISADGSRLVFERRESAAATVRIIAVDLKTGQTSDLFNGFEVAQNPPTAPAITPDGQTVATGGPFQQSSTGLSPSVTLTSLAPFPAGHFVHQVITTFGDLPAGQVANVAAGPGGLYVLQSVIQSTDQLVFVHGNAATSSAPITGPGAFGDPAVAASDPQFVLFVRRSSSPVNPFFAQGDIEFMSLTGPGGTTRLPAVVNSSLDESQPAVSADGRFIAFVRHGSDGHDHLFLWDSQTQLLLNPDGVDLGAITSRDVGNVSVYTQPVFSIGQVSISQVSNVALANVEARLTVHGGVGILVQRIVGRQRILGRREYKLRMVGRVPLGFFKKGRHDLHWNLRVNGRRLRPGRYLVTLRSLSRKGVVRDLAKPDVIRVR